MVYGLESFGLDSSVVSYKLLMVGDYALVVLVMYRESYKSLGDRESEVSSRDTINRKIAG